MQTLAHLFVTSTVSSGPQNGIALPTLPSSGKSCAVLGPGDIRMAPNSRDASTQRREALELFFKTFVTTIASCLLLLLLYTLVFVRSIASPNQSLVHIVFGSQFCHFLFSLIAVIPKESRKFSEEEIYSAVNSQLLL